MASERSRAIGPIALSSLLWVACDLAPPELPEFHTQITVPLASRSYSVLELLEDVDGIEIDADQIQLRFTGEVDSVSVDDELTTTLNGFSMSAELGPFELDDDLSAGTAFTFTDLAPPGTPTGDTVVPPFTFAVPPQNASGLDDVSAVTFDSGQLVVDVTNNMAVPLSGVCGASPGFHVVIEDAVSGATILDWQQSQEIAPGEVATRTRPLAGLSIGSQVTVSVTGCTPGSGGQVVSVAPSDEIAVDIRLVNATATSATSTVPEQTFVEAGSADLGGDLSLQQAFVSAGTMDLTFTNNTALTGHVELAFPGFSRGGAPLLLNTTLAPGETRVVPFDLSGAAFDAPAPVSSIDYTATVVTDSTGSTQVTLQSTDGVSVDASDVDLDLEWVVGVPDTIDETFGPFAETIEWPEETDGLLPAAASIVLTVHNEVGATITGSLVLRASNGTESDSLTHAFTIQPGALGARVTTTVTLDETNSTILDLLAFYPTDLEIDGTMTVGDGVSAVRLDRGALVTGDYAVTAPFAFTVTGATIQIDPTSVEMDQDMRDLLLDSVGRVAIHANLVNGFPFGAEATIMFDTDSASVFTNPMVTLSPVTAPAAEVDDGGKAEEPTTAQNALSLTEEEVETIAQPMIYVGVSLELAPSAGVIIVSPENAASISSVLVLDVTVDDALLGNDDD